MAQMDHYLGEFANDAAVDAWIAAKGWTHQTLWLYYRTSTSELMVWDGTVWVQVVRA